MSVNKRKEESGFDHPDLHLDSLDNLWFQVSGTLCNIACEHCFISCSPTNHSFEFMNLTQVEKYLKESTELGVKEYYFTGGEPFMNREIIPILEKTLNIGPATVLTNAMLLKENIVQELAHLEKQSRYSLEIRVSLDGYTAEMNDPIRGAGVFEKTMQGVRRLVKSGFLPIITITKTWDDSQDEAVLEGFTSTLKNYDYTRPRIKILPSIKIGREIARDRGYDKFELVTSEMLKEFDCSQLICSNSRVATDRGVYVCPILLDAPHARMGETLADSLHAYQLKDQACYTCYLYGAICSNISSVARDG